MQKEVISDRQGITLFILFLVGSAVVIIPGLDAKRDAWLAVAFSALITLPVSLIYARLLSLFPGKDLFDILGFVLGKTAGKIVSILYIWFVFHLGALVMRNFGEFILNVGLTHTPMAVPIFAMSLLCAWSVKEGTESLARISEFFVPLLIIFISVTFLSLIPKMDINNIFPMFYEGAKPFIKASFGLFSFPFAETVVFTMVLCCLKTKNSPYRLYIYSILIAGILGTLITLSVILVLGADIAYSAYFPSYMAVSRINIRNFIQSLEIVVSLAFLIAGFVKISICLLASCNGISKLLGYKDYRFIVLPVTLLMANLSIFVYDNIKQMYHWALGVWPYYAFLFQFIFPLIIFIAAEIKMRSRKLL